MNERSPRISRAIGATLISLALGATPTTASAEAPNKDLSRQAQTLLEEGLAALKANQWEKARALLLGAFRAHPHYLITPHLARTELKLGRKRDAAEHLTYFLREGKEITPADRAQAEKLLAEAREKIGTLVVSSNVSGTEVRIDGELVGITPLPGPVFVEPGSRLVRGKVGGYLAADKSVTIGPNQEIRVDLSLTRDPAVALANVNRVMEGDSRRQPGPNKAALVVLGVATGLAAAAGAGFMAGSFVKAAERDEQPCSKPDASGVRQCSLVGVEANRARVQLANASVGSFIGSGAALAATLGYWLATRPSHENTKPNVAVVVSREGAAATLTLSW